MWRLFRTCDFPGKTALCLSTWFGVGLLPGAPGTWGTVGALPLAVLLGRWGPSGRILVVALVCSAAFWSAARAQDLFQDRDPPQVVIDEVCGFLLAAATFPVNWQSLTLCFILFRFFDILKPFPIRRLEPVQAGVGVVLDDLLAGGYTIAAVALLLHVIS